MVAERAAAAVEGRGLEGGGGVGGVGSLGPEAQLWELSRSRGALRRVLAGLACAFVSGQGWERLGYPFASLTPSLATAIGSSGDRPAALAELMGIIVNDGARLPTVLVDRLDFAVGTPYETRVGRAELPTSQVLAPEIAAVVRGVLTQVVDEPRKGLVVA